MHFLFRRINSNINDQSYLFYIFLPLSHKYQIDDEFIKSVPSNLRIRIAYDDEPYRRFLLLLLIFLNVMHVADVDGIMETKLQGDFR